MGICEYKQIPADCTLFFFFFFFFAFIEKCFTVRTISMNLHNSFWKLVNKVKVKPFAHFQFFFVEHLLIKWSKKKQTEWEYKKVILKNPPKFQRKVTKFRQYCGVIPKFLTHFSPNFTFLYSPENVSKLTFSGDIDLEHWAKMV